MTNFADLLRQLNETTIAISENDIAQWAGFVLYIIETLDTHPKNQSTNAFLHALTHDLQTRIEEGSW